MAVVLGINGPPFPGHDPAAAVAVDGQILAAVEEERLIRVKRAIGFRPTKAVSEVLRVAGLKPRDVNVIAVPWLPRAMGYSESDAEDDIRRWLLEIGFTQSRKELKVQYVEHHSAHAWSGLAFARPSVGNRRIGVLIVDGSGECTAGAAYLFDGELNRLWHLDQRASLGIYFEALTEYLGFHWGEEGKTMGLASYGRPCDLAFPSFPDRRFDGPLQRGSVSPNEMKRLHLQTKDELLDQFHLLIGDPSNFTFNHRSDIALAGQNVLGDRILGYINEFPSDLETLVVAGGVALNCTTNSRIAELCRRKNLELVIPPPASDTGIALGAALAVEGQSIDFIPLEVPHLGAGFTQEQIFDSLRSGGAKVASASIEDVVCRLVQDDFVCGWFDGRSEIGPRALGSRSIIARPDSTRVRDRVNMLKGRESWRPLAPSVSSGEFDRSFAGSIKSRHMLISATASAEGHKRLKGVVHVDGTSRPQVVVNASGFLSLINTMGFKTGTEAVVCTSFNRAGEPIVYSPLDALDSARKMNLDALAGNGWMALL